MAYPSHRLKSSLFLPHSLDRNRCPATDSACHRQTFLPFSNRLILNVKQPPRVFHYKNKTAHWKLKCPSQKQLAWPKNRKSCMISSLLEKKPQHLFCQNRQGWDRVQGENNVAWRLPFWESNCMAWRCWKLCIYNRASLRLF